MGFAWNLILFSFVREREGYKHHADCTVPLTEECAQSGPKYLKLRSVHIQGQNTFNSGVYTVRAKIPLTQECTQGQNTFNSVVCTVRAKILLTQVCTVRAKIPLTQSVHSQGQGTFNSGVYTVWAKIPLTQERAQSGPEYL